MRLLIACPKCHRQYDATARRMGSHVHCPCGEVLTVSQPAGHDSAVVRCSSCGAPRRDEQQKCGFCGADFTLREQHLETICPHCFARLDDAAKFCDHCGHALAAEALPAAAAPLVCPLCKENPHLSNREVAGYAVLECKTCGGFWVGNEVLEHLIERAATQAKDALLRRREELSRNQPVKPRPSTGSGRPHGYLPCPLCGGLMAHQNFEHRSGVVIEVCKRHGVWFDPEKLGQLLSWVRAGGLSAAAEDREREQVLSENLKRRLEAMHPKGLGDDGDLNDRDFRTGPDWLLDFLMDLF